MSQIDILPDLIQQKLEWSRSAFRNFCDGVQHPLVTEDNYIIISVKLMCYRNSRIDRFPCEVILITRGPGLGYIRIFYREPSLLCGEIHALFERPSRTYALGRSARVLVVEDESGMTSINRVDLMVNMEGALPN